MSVDTPNKIDAVGVDRNTGEVVLTITDHREWDEPGHLLALQTKLNSYFEFIESGQIFQDYPEAAKRLIRINVVCRHEPTPDARGFLDSAMALVKEAGWSLSFEIYGPNPPLQWTAFGVH